MEQQESVSKSMRQVESKTHMGASGQWWFMFSCWLVGSLALVYPVSNRSIVYPYTLINLFILLLWWIIFIIYLRNTPVQNHTWLHIKFMCRAYTGKTLIMKYVVPVRVLENIIPIKTVHENGVIKFKFGNWGLIMRVSSDRIDTASLPLHLDIIKQVLDSMHDDIIIKIISSSYLDYAADLETSLLEMSNDTTKSEPQREHLYQLYREIAADKTDTIDWRCIIFIDLGKHSSIEDAEIKRQEFLPGFIDGLSKAEAYCVPVTDETAITLLYSKIALVR